MIRTSKQKLFFLIVLILAGLGLLAGLTFGAYQYALINEGGGNFLTYWVVTRALIKDTVSPYSAEAGERIAQAITAQAIPAREQLKQYPLPFYALIFSAPLALVDDFNLARAIWAVISLLCLFGSVLLTFKISRWRPPWWQMALIFAFSLFWLHDQNALKSGNAIFLCALFITAGLAALKDGADEFAGVLFGLATIKPNVALPAILFLIFWSVVNRHGRALGWLFLTLFFLSAGAALFFPDWIIQQIRILIGFQAAHLPGSPGALLARLWPVFGQRLAYALTAVSALLILLEWRVVLRNDLQSLPWGMFFTLAVAQWSGIYTSADNFVILLPALLYSLSLIAVRWQKGANGSVPVILAIVFILPLWAERALAGKSTEEILEGLMFFPAPLIVFFLLVWVRWWAVEKTQPWLEQINF